MDEDFKKSWTKVFEETEKNKVNRQNKTKTNDEAINPKDLIGQNKPPLSLIPPAGLIHLSMVMKNGAEKYGPYNWRDYKVQSMIYLDAIMRHIYSYLDGEDLAEDSGLSHLAHAMGCLVILLDAEETGNLADTRPKKGKSADIIKRFTKTDK